MRLASLARSSLAVASGLFAACLGDIREAIDNATARERYEASLDAAGLAGSAAVRDWKAAALFARDSALTLRAPFNESGYFSPDRAEARGYLIPVRRGQELVARFSVRGARAARLFADLYGVPEAPRHSIASPAPTAARRSSRTRSAAMVRWYSSSSPSC